MYGRIVAPEIHVPAGQIQSFNKGFVMKLGGLKIEMSWSDAKMLAKSIQTIVAKTNQGE